MCGRVNVSDHPGVQQLLEELGLQLPARDFEPRYNLPPSAQLWTVLAGPELVRAQWGLVPPWARPGRFSGPLINARAESAWDKPSFRKLMPGSRVLIPVNGFYEWQRQGRRKSAYYVRPRQGGGFALAGLYQVSGDGEPQCCILTTAANAVMSTIHDRMPVILPPGHFADWLNARDRGDIDAYLQPAPDDALELLPVGDYVNDARHEGPECLTPREPDADDQRPAPPRTRRGKP